MKAADLLTLLQKLGVRVSASDGKLRVSAPSGAMTDELERALRDRKADLLALLAEESPGEVHRTADESAYWSLSAGQERLWRILRRSPEDTSYNLPLAYRLRGPLDHGKLEAGIQRIVERHPVLRSPIQVREGRPVQCESPIGQSLVEQCDRSADPPDSQRLAGLLEGFVRKPFDLGTGPFLRALLLRMGQEDHVLLLVMHHLATDGWSFEVFFDELEMLYGTAGGRLGTDLPELPIRYRDFAAWQERSLAGPHGARLRQFWSAQFDPPPPMHAPPGALARGVDKRWRADLTGPEVAALAASASRAGGSLFMAALACYGSALRIWTGQEDCVICVPAACRERPELAGVIGYVNNVLPIRFSLHGVSTFSEIMGRVRKSVLAAYAHRDLPFQQIASLAAVRRVPLTRAMMSLQDEPLRGLRLRGVEVGEIVVEKDAPNFDLSLSLLPSADGLSLRLASRAGVVPDDMGRAVLDGFLDAAGVASRDPEAPLTSKHPASDVPAGRTETEDHLPSGAHAWMRETGEIGPDTDALVTQLTLIWERVLGVSGLAPAADFFDLGGHSLLAVSLIDEIERETGQVLPLATLVEHRTIQGLANVLRQEGWTPPQSVLVAMSQDGSGDPVFLVHSFEGHVFFYTELATSLGRSGPVYGLQAVGVSDVNTSLRTVEDMADRYLEEIRSVQDSGPYLIAAMCFGIAPALEVGRRLLADGEQVDVVLIDSVFEHLDPTPKATRRRRFNGPLARRLRAKAWTLRERLRRWREIRRATPYLRREMRLKDSIVRVWYRYEPMTYPGHLTLIRSQESHADPTRHWHVPVLKKLTSDAVRTIVIPGDHFTILREPSVETLATEILAARGPRAQGG